MPTPGSEIREIRVNRAPVLTLWAAVVAERLGHAWPDALTLGKALAGLNAQSKGRSLGIFKAAPGKPGEKPRPSEAEAELVPLLHRHIAVRRGRGGVRALERGETIEPEAVERYLHAKFRDALDPALHAMRALARSRAPRQLAEEGYALYESFRPAIPAGRRGWGAAGVLDLDRVREMARKR